MAQATYLPEPASPDPRLPRKREGFDEVECTGPLRMEIVGKEED